MPIFFLFSYDVLHQALNESIKNDASIVDREIINIAGNLMNEADSNCYLYATAQCIDKLSKSLPQDVIKRMTGFILSENKTHGVAYFDHVTSLPESAKN